LRWKTRFQGRVSKRQLPPLPPDPNISRKRGRCRVSKECVGGDIICIDREVYEHLGPLHQVTADLLVVKGKCRIIDEEEQGKERNPAPRRAL